MYGEPKMEKVGRRKAGPWLLTHAVWHNGYGACPETGVRWSLPDAGGYHPGFNLIQHGWSDFDAAESFIIKALWKGWNADRIERLMTWMNEGERWKRGGPRAEIL